MTSSKKRTIREKADSLPIYKIKYEILSQANKSQMISGCVDKDGNYLPRWKIFLNYLENDKQLDLEGNKDYYRKFIEIFGLREFYTLIYRHMAYKISQELSKEHNKEFPEGSSRRATGHAMRKSEKLKAITKDFELKEKPERKYT
tara:strand:- start:101 stop:535 length:435 start_codon:yes stop_codon:yes gene_type:complete